MKKILQLVPTALMLMILTPREGSAQREIPVDPFDGISVIGNINVTLEKGDPGSVALYAEGIPEDDISIKVTRGTLRMKVLNSWLYKNEIIRIYVPYERLRYIRANAGAQVECKDELKGDQMEIRIGSGAIGEFAIDVEKLESGASEGGQLTLMGKATSQNVSVGTGGQYMAFDLDCLRTYVRAGTGGEAEVVANELLEASANTGGRIIYQGDPDETRIKTFIAGEVEAY